MAIQFQWFLNLTVSFSNLYNWNSQFPWRFYSYQNCKFSISGDVTEMLLKLGSLVETDALMNNTRKTKLSNCVKFSCKWTVSIFGNRETVKNLSSGGANFSRLTELRQDPLSPGSTCWKCCRCTLLLNSADKKFWDHVPFINVLFSLPFSKIVLSAVLCKKLYLI